MPASDPIRLARAQLARDKARTARFPRLLARKIARMSASPLAFLRGSAPLFYEVLAASPSRAKWPAGEGWIAGDLHVENFGAYRPQAPADAGDATKKNGRDKDVVEFNLNDFDEAVQGPWAVDVLRVATSLIVAGRELGADGPRTLALCGDLLDGYASAAFDEAPAPAPPEPVSDLIERVRTRPHKALIDARVEVAKGKRRFVRGDRYFDLPREIVAAVPEALAAYERGLPERDRPKPGQLELVDAAFRVAGTGSLGALRIAALVQGKGVESGGWIFDLKEEGQPSAATLFTPPATAPVVRVETALRACVARPPRMLGTTTLDARSMLVRRLAPQEDKLDLTHLPRSALSALARYLGALTGAAHVRGATTRPTRGWTNAEREELIDGAIAMAGIHESAYLAWCRIAR